MPVPSTYQLPAHSFFVLIAIHTLLISSDFSSTGKEAGGACVTQNRPYNNFHAFNKICILNNVQ